MSKKDALGQELPAMESLFLETLDELEEHLGYLLTERFASHTLRIMLLVLSGQPITRAPGKGGNSALQSKKKEHVTVMGAKETIVLEERAVPPSFTSALEHLISQCIAGLDTDFLRSLSVHATGNPTLQLLLQVEMTQFGKQRAKEQSSIIHILLPDDPIVEESGSASFINGLVYDSLGSRLLEAILEYAPGKTFKNIYRVTFRERLATLARNDIASYVVAQVLTRLSKEELAHAVEALCPAIPKMVADNRFVVLRSLIEQCVRRGADTTPIADELQATYNNSSGGFDIARLLKLGDAHPTPSTNDPTPPSQSSSATTKPSPANDRTHPSLLAQTMLTAPGPLSSLILTSLPSLPTPLLHTLAHTHHLHPTITAALTSPHASLTTRRKLIARFYGHCGAMSLDPSASRVIDAVWRGTHGLAFIRERVAEELAENEAALRASPVGRMVWRNWRLDLYRRRRAEWVMQSRSSVGSDAFVGFPEDHHAAAAAGAEKGDGGADAEAKKGGIQEARERHARRNAGGAGKWKESAKTATTGSMET
jgi:nucleolar protein 9